MALETLKDIEAVNEHKIIRLSHNGMTKWPNEYTNLDKQHINIDDDQNIISFKIQDGPIKINGHNGCQVDEIISTALLMVKGLNKKFPCDENVAVITCLYEAYSWLQQRKLDREIRGVEGQSKV